MRNPLMLPSKVAVAVASKSVAFVPMIVANRRFRDPFICGFRNAVTWTELYGVAAVRTQFGFLGSERYPQKMSASAICMATPPTRFSDPTALALVCTAFR